MFDLGLVINLVRKYAPGVSPAVIEQAVTDWLDAHPEATTTVEDGSITEEKLAQDVLAQLGEISTLSEAITNIGTALLACMRNVAWADNNGQELYDDLYEAITGQSPDPYDYFDYIKGDGTAFIDTGLDAQVYGVDSCERVLKFEWTSFASTDYPYVTGIANASGTDVFYICGEKSASNTTSYIYLAKQYQTITIQRDAVTEIGMLDKKIYRDGEVIYTGTNASRSVSYAMNIPLFAIANGSSQYQGGISYDGYYLSKPCPAKIYEFTVNDGQGNPVAHMIPAKRKSDNVVGMWDTVREQFFVNANESGSFTVGNDE